jgi:hypothetical protein
MVGLNRLSALNDVADVERSRRWRGRDVDDNRPQGGECRVIQSVARALRNGLAQAPHCKWP